MNNEKLNNQQQQGEAVAWIVHTPGSYAPGPKAILRSQYDVESPAFWANGQPPRNAEITRLYPAPPAAPDLCEVVLKILKEAVNIPDSLYARAQFLAKNPASYADPAEVERLREERDETVSDLERVAGERDAIAEVLAIRVKELAERNALLRKVPDMPKSVDRRLFDDADPDGYLEGDGDWCDNNPEVVAWLIENHAAIRAALSASAEGNQCNISLTTRKD